MLEKINIMLCKNVEKIRSKEVEAKVLLLSIVAEWLAFFWKKVGQRVPYFFSICDIQNIKEGVHFFYEFPMFLKGTWNCNAQSKKTNLIINVENSGLTSVWNFTKSCDFLRPIRVSKLCLKSITSSSIEDSDVDAILI